jgi:predicted outer membrane repeat protein
VGPLHPVRKVRCVQHFEAGGIIGFRCGNEMATIKLSEVMQVKNSVTLDGGNKVTIDGQDKTRLFIGANEKNLILMNMTLTNGLSGDDKGAGAIHTGWRGNVGLVNVILEKNKNRSGKERAGGALSTHEGVGVVFKSTFRQNEGSGNGGGINNLLASLYVYNTTFEANTTGGSGGAIYSDGAGFYGDPVSAKRTKTMPRMLSVCGTKFLNNVSNNGGAVYFFLYQDGADATNFDSIQIDRTLVKGNKSNKTHAGGLYLQGAKSANKSVVIVKDTTLEGNSTGSYGGGMIMSGPFESKLENVTFYGNEALGDNGQGAALFLEDAKITANNITVVKNKALKAGGTLAGPGTVNAKNSIFIDNEVTQPWDKNKNNCHTPLASKGSGNFQYLGISPASTACHAEIVNNVNPFPAGIPSLADNGGPVPTLALPKDSPILGKGSDCLQTDARAKTRPAACDPGAFQSP